MPRALLITIFLPLVLLEARGRQRRPALETMRATLVCVCGALVMLLVPVGQVLANDPS